VCIVDSATSLYMARWANDSEYFCFHFKTGVGLYWKEILRSGQEIKNRKQLQHNF
jgi:hypothetical protein